MTLMTVVSLDRLAAAVSEMLKTGGHFVFTITHPCFWPAYWGYAGAPWFSYGEEIFIEAPFKISNEASDFVTTHIHRPIERYVNVLNSAGFSVIAMVEPMPKAEIQALYPEPWHFPRFLGMKCIKVAV
jgi:hypothetical protein